MQSCGSLHLQIVCRCTLPLRRECVAVQLNLAGIGGIWCSESGSFIDRASDHWFYGAFATEVKKAATIR